MSRFHNTPEGERVAINWHRLAMVICAAECVMAGCALAWHVFAVREHRQHIKEMEQWQGET